MGPRFQFTTRRLLMLTTVLAVWAAVFVCGFQGISIPSAMAEVVGLAVVVIVPLSLVALAAIFVRKLGKHSILAACFGTAAYIALIALLSWATWS